ncbi:MAG: hypothetical protein OEL83_08445 [Desulforhopalus sp.]|nr:hypothetical protein [Desulforhopalus sp.]
MRFQRVFAALLTPFVMMVNCPVLAVETGSQQAMKLVTEIRHTPVENAEAGERISLFTDVSDPNGVDVVRVYFKSQDAADYSFVALKAVDKKEESLLEKFKNLNSDFNGQKYSGVLPAPANGAKSFDYLILVKNKANMVVKSQSYKVVVNDNDKATATEPEPVNVYSELNNAPTQIEGFTDNITIDLAESTGKVGVVAGLYNGISSGGAGSAYGGTVVASSAGITTTAVVVGATVAVVAIGGGVAIASGGSDGNGDGGGSSGEPLTATTIVGSWNTSGRNTTGFTSSGSANFAENGAFSSSYTLTTPAGGTISGSPSNGSWSLSGSTLSITDSQGTHAETITGGNSRSFTTTSGGGWTTTYTR